MPNQKKIEAARWFRQASHDLEAVAWNIQGKFYDTACFLAQQTAEKALFTHSLAELIEDAGKSVTALKDLAEEARQLDLHYVPSRYPNGLPSGFPHRFYGKKTADDALNSAKTIFDAVRNHYLNQNDQEILLEKTE